MFRYTRCRNTHRVFLERMLRGMHGRVDPTVPQSLASFQEARDRVATAGILTYLAA